MGAGRLNSGAGERNSVNELHLELDVLSALYDLSATPEQVKAIAGMAEKTASKKKVGDTTHPGPQYKSALVELRDAYVKKDDNAIATAQDTLDNMEEKMDNVPDPKVEITEEARRKVDEMIKLFSPGQIAEYISARSDDAPDPAGMLVAAIDDVQGEDARKFAKTRERMANEAAAALGGIDLGGDHKTVHDDVTAFLNKVHGMSDDDLKSKHGDLEREAKELGTIKDPLESISNWIQRDMVRLLSNPELPEAIAAMQK
jgi:hypothetical protein